MLHTLRATPFWTQMKIVEKAIQKVGKNGYAFISGFSPMMPHTDIAHLFGVNFARKNFVPHTHLRPKKETSEDPNSYSGIYGFGKFPFHTDFAHWRVPPRYLILRCLKGFRDVPTLLIDGARIIDLVGNVDLQRSLVRPRRPVNGKMPLLRLLQVNQRGQLLRWDRKFFRPASDVGIVGVANFSKAIKQMTPTRIALENIGDTLIVDNWRMLHARAPVPSHCESRHIVRTYLESFH